MKVRTIWAVVWLGLLAVSCRQDPIFYVISTETSPRKPRIEGAPTNMAVFQRVYPDPDQPDQTKKVPILYVASGRLHWYAQSPDTGMPQWDVGEYPIPQPEGKIIALAVTRDAVTGDRLYALCRDGHGINAILRYIESGGDEWKTVRSHTAEIQSIYADPQSRRLFAGAGRNTYDILYLDNTDTLKTLKSNTAIFSGAVCREEAGKTIYYVSTRGDGIFRVSEDTLHNADLAGDAVDPGSVTQLVDNTPNEFNTRNNRLFMSLIKLQDNTTIIAVERDGGSLYAIPDDSSGSFVRMRYTFGNNDWIATGKYATKAIALWEDYLDPQRKLLITGIQGGLYSTTTSSYTYGYVEFELLGDSFNTAAGRHDPGGLHSVEDQDRYTTSLGKHPINHLFQTPREIDPDMTFFASTQTAGLWSYRNRPDNGGWQWNAEE